MKLSKPLKQTDRDLSTLLAIFMITALLFSLAGRHHLKQAVINNQASIIGAISDKYQSGRR